MSSEPVTDNKPKGKRGRPSKPEDELRQWPIKVYFDEDSFNAIVEIAEHDKKSRSTVAYEFILNGHIKEPLTKEQTADLRNLAGMANNLNQLAHEAHVNYTDDLAQRNYDLADKIDAVLDKLGDF